MSLKIPKLRHHKARNQAAVVLEDGRYRYLGPWGSEEAQRNYDRLIQEWLTNGRRAPDAQPQAVHITITELVVRYFEFASTYYVKNGKPTKERANIRLALRGLRRLYGPEPAAAFGPKKLKAVRNSWIDVGHSRKYINKQIGRVRRMFQWGVAEELVPGSRSPARWRRGSGSAQRQTRHSIPMHHLRRKVRKTHASKASKQPPVVAQSRQSSKLTSRLPKNPSPRQVMVPPHLHLPGFMVMSPETVRLRPAPV